MEEERKKRKARKALQWHPAFFAGIQIELAEEAENLIFESEHQLGTKPMRMDTLIIKKEKELPIFKNIGRIFRKYNIMEYKSPKDYMGVDDFFKIYGYTYFYKADAPGENRIPITELTITMVGSHYPEKLFQYFREELGYETEAVEPGIYYVKGDRIPIQFIVTEMLLEEENPWLRSLTDHLESASLVDKLFSEYQKHDRNRLYESVIRAVVDANYEMFKEEESMDSFIRELFQDEIEEAERRAMQRGLEKGLKQGIEQGL
ncbi:MAG: 3-isopropylmalate dehydrogenase, partial [Eubacteriales bacterium]|nr:3-isopropylmalate dehydrogenase [Eubacteriales bacterium]